jgi:hypothetical protein
MKMLSGLQAPGMDQSGGSNGMMQEQQMQPQGMQ